MEDWIALGDAAARVVEGVRSRMNEPPDLLRTGTGEPANNAGRCQRSEAERKSEASPEGPPARLAVAAIGRNAPAMEETGRIAGREHHATVQRGGSNLTVTPSRVVVTNDASRARERARAGS